MSNKNVGRPLDQYHLRALNKAAEARRIARMEARVDLMLSTLAEKPRYRQELEEAMGLSRQTLYPVVRYAKENNWIVSQGRYYVNPHTVKIEGGKVIRDGGAPWR